VPPDRADHANRHAAFVAAWSSLHGGYPASRSRIVSRWLRLMERLARPLARAGVAPDLITVAAVVVAAASCALTADRWLLMAAAACAAANGVLDGLDGAVAAMTGRATPWGAVLDSVADRVADLALLAAMWLAGADVAATVAAGVALWLLEYTRARATGAGMTEISSVTVGERPARVAVTAATFAAAAAAGHVDMLATVGAAAVGTLAFIGWLQLLATARHALR
jgi:CDP-diacylglycerol--glycerol-3-phosphate 3-phosphatidyltransferase